MLVAGGGCWWVVVDVGECWWALVGGGGYWWVLVEGGTSHLPHLTHITLV